MVKCLYKFSKAVVNDIFHALPILGESGSEVSYFVPEPRNFAEVTRLSEDIKKRWLKVNMKQITNLIKGQTFLVQDPEKGDPVTPFMDVYKSKTHSDGSLDKLKLRIVFRGYLQNKELFGDTWSSNSFPEGFKILIGV